MTLEQASEILHVKRYSLLYPIFPLNISLPHLVWDLFIFPDFQHRIPLLPFVWVALWLLEHVSCKAGTLLPPSCNVFVLEEECSAFLVRSWSIENNSKTKNRKVPSL